MRLELFPNIKLIEDVGHLRALSAPSIMSKEHISRSSIDSTSTGSSLLASSVSSSLAANQQQTSSTDDEAAAAVEEEEAQYVIKVLGFDFHDPNGWIHLHTKVGQYTTPVIVEGHQLSILQAIAEAAALRKDGLLSSSENEHLRWYASTVQNFLARNMDSVSYAQRLAWMLLTDGAERFHHVFRAMDHIIFRDGGAIVVVNYKSKGEDALCHIDDVHFLAALIQAETLLRKEARKSARDGQSARVDVGKLPLRDLSKNHYEAAFEAPIVWGVDLTADTNLDNAFIAGPAGELAFDQAGLEDFCERLLPSDIFDPVLANGPVVRVETKQFAANKAGEQHADRKMTSMPIRSETHQTTYTSFTPLSENIEIIAAVEEVKSVKSVKAAASVRNASLHSFWKAAITVVKKSLFPW